VVVAVVMVVPTDLPEPTAIYPEQERPPPVGGLFLFGLP
jgi:hypothetical protein